MDKETRILMNQMKAWQQQYNLSMTSDFKELAFDGGSFGNFPVNRIKKLSGVVYKDGKKVHESIAHDFCLTGAKEVVIRGDRKCANCGLILPKGSKAITTSRQVRGVGERYWWHIGCANQQLAKAERMLNELQNNEEPDWDDGKSSNGL